MSFILSKLMIADAAREHNDLLNQRDMEGARDGTSRHLTCQDTSHLDARFRAVLENAPSFFQVGSDAGAGTDIEVQRWLLQQAVFSALLRLHRVALSSKAKSRTSCVLLARSILDMQKKLRSRCTVVDRLWIILIQSFNAAVVLCLDLFTSPSTPAMRDIVRSEISEAVDALRLVESSNSGITRSIRVLEALMAEEEAQWKRIHGLAAQQAAGSSKRKRSEEAGASRKAVLSLAQRVKRAVEGNPLPEDSDQVSQKGSTNGSVDGTVQKDDFAKEIMDQVMHPQFANVTNSVDTGSFGPQGIASNAFPAPVGAGPNGFAITPPGAQNFDLSAFLAQMESSPTSASDDVHSIWSSNNSSAGGEDTNSSRGSMHHTSTPSRGSASGASTDMTHPSRGGSIDDAAGKAQQVQRSFVGQDQAQSNTGLDGFWDWIFSQGNASQGANPDGQAPAMQQQQQQQHQQHQAQVQAPAAPSQPTQRQSAEDAQSESRPPASDAPAAASAPAPAPAAVSAPTPESYFALPGGAPLLNGSLLPTPMPVAPRQQDDTTLNAENDPQTPSKAAGVTGLEQYNAAAYGLNQHGTSAAGSVGASGAAAGGGAGTPFSMGTPSSGFDSWFTSSLESFMQT